MGKSDIEIAVLRHIRARMRELYNRQQLRAPVVLCDEVIRSMTRIIYEAVTEGNIVKFEALVRDNEVPILTEVTPQGNTILHLAAIYGHSQILEPIIAHEQRVVGNQNPMPNDYQRLLLRRNSSGDLPLHVAAARGHASVVKALIGYLRDLPDGLQGEVGVRDVWVVQNNEGNTALHLALKAKHEAVALSLLKVDHKVSFITNNKRESPLYMATEAGNLSLVNQMLQNRPAQLEGRSVVHAAVKSKNIDILRCLLDYYPGLVDARDEEGRSLLSYIAFVGYDNGIPCLLEGFGNMAYVRDPDGFFPIHSACRKGHLGALQRILQFCPDTIELLNMQGQNVIHIAAECGKEEVVKYFLRNKKYEDLINQKDHEGNTPLHLATMFWYPKIVHRLTRDERVNLGEMNNLGFTALDAAEECMDLNPTFRERLTWMALVCVGTPRALTLMPHDPALALGQRGAREGIIQHLEMHNIPALAPGQRGAREGIIEHLEMRDDPAVAPGQRGPQAGIIQRLEMRNDPGLAPGQRRPQEGILQHLEMPTAKKYKDRVNTLLLLAILVATVAFSAAFSVTRVPEEETKHWYKPVMLQIFMVSNTVAMYSAVLTTVALIWAQLGDLVLILNVFKFVLPLLGLAFISMSVAFLAGMLVVVGNQVWLPVLLVASGGVFLVTLLLLVVPFISHTLQVQPFSSMCCDSHLCFLCSLWLMILTMTWNESCSIVPCYSYVS